MSGNEPICTATAEGHELFIGLHSAFDDGTSEERIYELIKGTAMEYIGQGDSRVVLLDGSGQYLHEKDACVVKIEKPNRKDQNKKEVQNWENSNGEMRHHLLRPTDWDDQFRYVVMPYLDTEVTNEMMFEMEKAFIEQGKYVGDVKKKNAARVQDRAVLLDYGGIFEDLDFTAMTEAERISMKRWRWDLD